MIPTRVLGLTAALAAASLLAACEDQGPAAPTAIGVCYKAEFDKGGKVTFNKVAENMPTVLHCEVELEKVRMRFLGLGSDSSEIVGAYQGNFIWVAPAGIFVSSTLKGHRYPSMLRDENGKLVIPGQQNQQPQ